MDLSLPAAERKRLHDHAQAGYPAEVVGVLAGDRASGAIRRVHPLRNERADRPDDRYEVSGMTLYRAEQQLIAEGMDILGYYHSHPDHPADYSAFDRDHALPDMSYIIVSVRQGAAVDTKSWRLTEDRGAMTPEPLILLPDPLPDPE